MSTEYPDLVIRRARLRARGSDLFDIAVSNGRISAIEPNLNIDFENEIDAKGNLVSESFVNPHLHMCKVWSLEKMDDLALVDYHSDGMSKAMSAINRAREVKRLLTYQSMVKGARRAAALAVVYGNLHIRAFADVDSISSLNGVKALIDVRDEFSGLVDIQVAAFPQDGILKDPGTADLMKEAMELGADVVGGIPWIELSDGDAMEHINICFNLAQEYNKDVSMLLDDAGDSSLRTLEMMALETIKRNWQNRALAHHCRAMGEYPLPYFYRLTELLRRAGLAIVTDPHTGPLHARVKELIDQSILVSIGQDDISDAYYPFGRNNMLEVAFLASHLLWMTTREETGKLYDLITIDAARSINIPEFGLAVGSPANLVVLDQPNELEALRFHRAPVCVVSKGKKVDIDRMRGIAEG
ncbi:MAG: amidohydrolase family protein [Pseudomonadota bacterium]|nr:amidohydrolase family protein [Pseudomonadota bacterium]